MAFTNIPDIATATAPTTPLPPPLQQHPKYNFMERGTFLTIPYQAFEAENVFLLPHQIDFQNRRYTTLSYKDSAVELNDLPILTPPLSIQRYDSSKSILYLVCDNEQFLQKFAKFQECLVSTYIKHTPIITNPNTQNDIRVWLKKDSIPSPTKNNYIFKLLLRDNILSIFVNQNMLIQTSSGYYKKISELTQGTKIRCLLRIFNVLLLSSGEMIIGEKKFFRIHHSVPSIWLVD
jgi:hypothetical protein